MAEIRIRGDELFTALEEVAKSEEEGISNIEISVRESTIFLKDGRKMKAAIMHHCGINRIEISVEGKQGLASFREFKEGQSRTEKISLIMSAFEEAVEAVEGKC